MSELKDGAVCIEVILRDRDEVGRTIQYDPPLIENIKTSLTTDIPWDHRSLEIGEIIEYQDLADLVGHDVKEGNLDPAAELEKIQVSHFEGKELYDFIRICDVVNYSIRIAAYTLKSALNEEALRTKVKKIRRHVENLGGKFMLLPSDLLKDDWDSFSISYPSPVSEKEFSPLDLFQSINNFLQVTSKMNGEAGRNRCIPLCDLYGEAGSNLITLVRALSQKLSVWFKDTFPVSYFVEINGASLLGAAPGETQTQIATFFAQIHKLARSSDALVCVSIHGVQCLVDVEFAKQDALGFNEFLKGVEGLRASRNIFAFCSDTATEENDSEVHMNRTVDTRYHARTSVWTYVSSLGPSRSAYNDLRACLNEMVHCGFVHELSSTSVELSDIELDDRPSKKRKTHHDRLQEDWQLVNLDLIPDYKQARADRDPDSERPGSRLLEIVDNLSLKIMELLHSLPMAAFAQSEFAGSCTMHEMLDFLEAKVEEMEDKLSEF